MSSDKRRDVVIALVASGALVAWLVGLATWSSRQSASAPGPGQYGVPRGSGPRSFGAPQTPGPGIITIEEEEGILLIEARPEYSELVARHGARQVTVRAVNLHDPGEAQFLTEIDPGFVDQPGCVIVLEAPGEGYVYQLDEDFNVVHRITLAEWHAGAAQVDADVIDDFTTRLN